MDQFVTRLCTGKNFGKSCASTSLKFRLFVELLKSFVVKLQPLL